MKNPIESSVISRSQSDANTDKGKLQLTLGTTTKFDSIFPILDQICLKTRLPKIFYYLSAAYLYYQVIFSSLYPFNRYWNHVFKDKDLYQYNLKIIKGLSYMEKVAFFFNIDHEKIETNLFSPIIILLICFVFSVLVIIVEIFGSSRHHKVRKFIFHAVRFVIDILSPVLLIPSSAVIGMSIRNLFLNGSEMNWIYLFSGLLLFFIFLIYTYLGLILLNQSTCILITPFSSFSIQLPLFLPSICSLFIIFQCIFSLFHSWAMIITQLSHLVLGVIVFYPMGNFLFHNRYANVFFNGVTLSTWMNDIIFVILYFISPKNEEGSDSFHFYYVSGLATSLFTLVISLLIANAYVHSRVTSILKELKKIGDRLEDDTITNNQNLNIDEQDNDYNLMLSNNKLFKNETLTLMSIHISFTNCLPLFYKWSAINYAINRFQTNQVLLSVAQYLSFFPGASRKLNNYLKIISQNRDLKYHQRFLLFQIFRIKTMRQSSISPEANHKLSELRTSSTEVFEDVVSFWSLKAPSVPYLEMIAKENSKIDSRWEEAIRDFPNFQKFSDEYCSFLLECKMNVPKAIIMKHRATLIEMGRNFTIDVPFKCFAKSFPSYLKNGIVDSQGSFRQLQRESTTNNSASHTLNITTNSQGSNGANATNSTSKVSSTGSTGSNGSSKFSSSSSSMLSSDFDLDPEFEETLGRQLFKQSLLRIELYRALAHKSSYPVHLILYNSFVVLAIGLGFFIGLYLYVDGYIKNRSFALVYLNVASRIRYCIDMAILGSTLKFSYFTKRFTTFDFYNSLDAKDRIYDKTIMSSFHVDDFISASMIHPNVIISRTLFNVFVIGLAELSTMGGDIYALTKDMMTNIVPFYTCFNGIPSNEFKMSLKALEPYIYLMLEQIAAKDVEEGNWFSSNEVCEIMTNQEAIEASTMNTFQSLIGYEVFLSDLEDKTINMYSILFTIFPIFAYLAPMGLFMWLFVVDTNKKQKFLLDVDQHFKEEAKKQIRKDPSYEQPQTSEKRPRDYEIILPLVIMICFCIGNSILIYFMLSETKELNTNVKNLARWDLTASIRLASAVEAMNYMLNSVILNGSDSLNVPSSPKVLAQRSKMLEFCRLALDQLETSNEGLSTGDGVAPSCRGFDEQVDQLNFLQPCEVTNNDTDLHDSYRCSSTSQGVSIYISLIRSILEDIESTGGVFDNEKIPHSLHLLNTHLLQKLDVITERFNNVNIENCGALEKKALIIFITGLILNILIFLMLFYFYLRASKIFSTLIAMMQRLPPNIYITNKKLQNFILNRKESKNEHEMSTSQSVIFMSLDAIICTNVSGVIEIINPAVTSILGYTPDQMLGQNISVFFANFNNANATENQPNENKENEAEISGDAERVTNQIELMKNGQSALVFEDHFTCVTDNDKEMPCGVTILGMTNHHHDENNLVSGNVESFVFIIRDETQLMEQQKAAEAAKAQSENLLFQILPRDIVARINSGEKDISFTVQSASIIFTDIVKFSEYASNLSPQEIMGSLSTLFATFDICAKKYKLITKIKLIGDIYMAAAGLFSDENDSPKDHAEQILRFGLDCLSELDDINMKLNANLQLRVGINSGGPILAGVLGTDKPVFDIIGDPINVAARLQTTDVPGKAQIPKSTYDLVCDADFTIEERGEVFLKGKGKTMTYLVSPTAQSSIVPLDSTSSAQLL